MTPSIRKKFITSVTQEHATQSALDMLSVLLILMKKFGKQLSQSPVKEFVQKNYPEVYTLYELLGGVRLTSKDCLIVKQHLYESLWESAVVAYTTDGESLRDVSLESELVVVDGGDSSTPSLTIKSPSRVYKRSLLSDLQKLL